MRHTKVARASSALSAFGESSLLLKRAAKVISSAGTPLTRRAARSGVLPSVEHLQVIRSLQPRSVIDVGANYGQFALAVSLAASTLEALVLVEPNPQAAAALGRLFPGGTQVVPKAAGPGGQRTLYVTRDDDNSSLKTPDTSCEGYEIVGTTEVEMVSLDTILSERAIQLPRPILIKIDVQGSESEVLESGRASLESGLIDALVIELSFERSYSGASGANAIIRDLDSAGFQLRSVWNVRRRRSNTAPFQCDALFTPSSGDATA